MSPEDSVSPAVALNPATAAAWGPFVQAAYDQFRHDPGEPNPASVLNLPAGWRLLRTIQMTDFIGPEHIQQFYGYVAVGGTPPTAVVALRGTVNPIEWWDDLHWDPVAFTPVKNGGNVGKGFMDIYQTFTAMDPVRRLVTASVTESTFAGEIAQACIDGLEAQLTPSTASLGTTLPVVFAGHSLGGALGTLLVADLAANTPVHPSAYTFASPRVGDASFAARYGALSGVSWRIYNQADVVPYFPKDPFDNYQHVNTGYAINSIGKAHWSLVCAHELNTYVHVLNPAIPLNADCQKHGLF